MLVCEWKEGQVQVAGVGVAWHDFYFGDRIVRVNDQHVRLKQ
jgi:hypothetical protein